MDLKETGWKVVDWIHLCQGMRPVAGLVNKIMNLLIPRKAGNFLTS